MLRPLRTSGASAAQQFHVIIIHTTSQRPRLPRLPLPAAACRCLLAHDY
jgi:hypothetical protein